MKKSSLEKLINMTGSKLWEILVVATLAARVLDIWKGARDPSGESWNYFQVGCPVLLLK
jgi:hypothetical protein